MLDFLIFMVIVIAVMVILSVALFGDEIQSTKDRDPAAKNHLEIILFYPGLHAIIAHRVNHTLWKMKVPLLPRAISQFTRFLTGIEIHPAAQIGKGLFIDHGMGVVVGETAIIGNNVTLFQGVTLGGTGKETGKRHPTIGDNVVIGAGAKVLGNITIGSNSYVGANAVVLRNVPERSTVVGVPGHIAKQDGKRIEGMLDHTQVSDPMMQNIKELLRRIKNLESDDKGEPVI